jgi:hypothetical protein
MYSQLPMRPDLMCADGRTFCVGVEREGGILAERMGWLPPGRSLRIHAKRIGHEGGLIVGLSGCPSLAEYNCCVIIDGAIASGATMIAVMEQLRSFVSTFRIFTVHASIEGLRGLVRYAAEAGIDLVVVAAHATEGMNAKFYAIDPNDPGRVMVGDLGDTISDLGKR